MSISVVKEKTVLVIESPTQTFFVSLGWCFNRIKMKRIAGCPGIYSVALVVILAITMAGYRFAPEIHVSNPVEVSSLPLKNDFFTSIPVTPLYFEEVPLFSFSGPTPIFLRLHFSLTSLATRQNHPNVLKANSWLYCQNKFALWLHVPVFIWVRCLRN